MRSISFNANECPTQSLISIMMPASGEPPEPIDKAVLASTFHLRHTDFPATRKPYFRLFPTQRHPGKERVGRCVVFSGIRFVQIGFSFQLEAHNSRQSRVTRSGVTICRLTFLFYASLYSLKWQSLIKNLPGIVRMTYWTSGAQRSR